MKAWHWLGSAIRPVAFVCRRLVLLKRFTTPLKDFVWFSFLEVLV